MSYCSNCHCGRVRNEHPSWPLEHFLVVIIIIVDIFYYSRHSSAIIYDRLGKVGLYLQEGSDFFPKSLFTSPTKLVG